MLTEALEALIREETGYEAARRKNTRRLRVERAAAAEIVRDLSAWTVHEPGKEDLQDAIEIQRRYQISFWDVMIVRSAIALGCELLWSEDLNSGQEYGGVEVRNPFEG